ncbi:hypothetical protein PSP6_250077 [Paraburkholderia tropica]|nr:hypothetical protein PSP6_250077 [Paraburkholderia tropica]
MFREQNSGATASAALSLRDPVFQSCQRLSSPYFLAATAARGAIVLEFSFGLRVCASRIGLESPSCLPPGFLSKSIETTISIENTEP